MTEHFCCLARKKKVSVFKKVLIFLFFLALVSILVFNIRILPVLEPYAKAEGTTAVTAKIQSIIGESVSADFGELVKLKYDDGGNVVSLETNTLKISLLNAKIIERVTKELKESNRLFINVPLGNLTGGALFTGRGPQIKIPLSVSPKIVSNVENAFFQSGINQTLHRVVAKIKVETFILLPPFSKKIEVETSLCLAETVIVGKVPDAYTQINRFTEDVSETDIDDVYDFGAY